MATPYYYRVKATANTTGPLSATGTATTTAEDAPPAFAAIPEQTAAVGVALNLNVAAYVSGYPIPSIALSSSTAAGSDYSFAGGTLTYTPSAAGSYTFAFLASNSLGTASGTVEVAVSAAPVLVPTASIADVTSNSLTVNWTATTGGTEYQVQVATDNAFSGGGAGGALLEEDFAALTDSTPPAGWTSSRNSDLDYVSTPYYGAAVPAFKFSTSGQTLTSPTFATGATNLEFWAFGNNNSGSTIAVSGLVSGVWALVDTKTIAINGATYRVTLDPQTTQIKFVFTKVVNCAMDDVVVTGAGTGGSLVADATVAALTYPVAGLEPETPYYARVRAVGGDWSEVVSATTEAGAESAPSFAAIPGQNATLGALFTLNVAAYVSGSPAPALALVSSTASGADYAFAGGTLTYTPSAAGSYTFAFLASNALGTASGTVAVSVAEGPILVPTASIADVSSNSFRVNWTATTGGSNYQVQVATDTNFTSGGVVGSNLMTNAGFETGDTTGWGTVESPYAVTTDTPHTGSYCISCVGATSTRDLDQQVAIPAADGTMPYVISYWYRVTGGDGSDVRIWAQWNNGAGSGSSLQPTEYNASSTEWTQVVLTNTPAAGATNLDFEVRTYTGATAYFDDFSVVPVGYGRKAGSLHLDATVSALTYEVLGLEPSTPYYARVRAVGGDWSQVVSATTTAGGEEPEPIAEWGHAESGDGMAMRIQTRSGVTYAMEYTTNLWAFPPVWIQIDSALGDGGMVDLEDADPADAMRYYRVVRP